MPCRIYLNTRLIYLKMSRVNSAPSEKRSDAGIIVCGPQTASIWVTLKAKCKKIGDKTDRGAGFREEVPITNQSATSVNGQRHWSRATAAMALRQ